MPLANGGRRGVDSWVNKHADGNEPEGGWAAGKVHTTPVKDRTLQISDRMPP